MRTPLSSRPDPSPGTRVLVITQHPFPFQPSVRRNVSALLASGSEVDLLCMASRNVASWRLAADPRLHVRALKLDHRRTSFGRYVFEAASFFTWAAAWATALSLRHRYRAVLVDNLPDPLVFTAAVAKARGARVVFEMFELTPEMLSSRMGVGRHHPLVRLAVGLERLATWWSDAVTVVSLGCADVLSSRGVSPAKMTVVPNSPSRSELRHRWSPPAGPILVTHCTLVPRYGVDVAIEALAQLAPRWPGIGLRVLGDGEDREKLARLAERLGVGEHVELAGVLPWADAMREICQASLGLVTIIEDGYGELLLPNKLFEYVLHGIPVVCARLPTIARHFPADSVSYFAPGDPADLARAIDGLLAAPGRAHAQARRAEKVADALTWERTEPMFLAALGLSRATARA